MAITLRSLAMLAAGDAYVYKLGERQMGEVSYAESSAAEKRHLPVPVGAGDAARFRTRCVGCMKCISACPSGVLRPSSKARHFGRPALDLRYGWCRPECNLCAEACPAGAIRRGLTPEQKKGLHTGIAVWHGERCVAATGKDKCNACSRHCPVGAISLVAKEGASAAAPKIPKIDTDKCIGCGACEHFCPARPKAAVIVEGRC